MVTEKNNLPEVEVKVLPSKGIAYPSDYSIKFRPFTFGEVVKINQSDVSIMEHYKQVLEGITCSFDKELLTFFDFQFIGLQRRGFTMTDMQLYTEGECLTGHYNTDVAFRLSELDFYDLEVDKLPKSFKYEDKTYSFNPFTIGDYFALFTSKQLDDKVRILAQQCTDPNKKKIYRELSAIPNMEIFANIKAIDSMFSHGVKHLKVPCNHVENGVKCTEDVYVDMTEVGSLVAPFRAGQERLIANIF